MAALLVGNLAPEWTSAGTTLVSAGLLAVALAAAVVAVAVRPGPRKEPSTARGLIRTAAGALAVAAAVGALVSQTVALRVGEEERIGWAETLRAEQPVRVAVDVTGEPRELESSYGARRGVVTVDVTAFGPGQQAMAESAPVPPDPVRRGMARARVAVSAPRTRRGARPRP